MCGHTLSLTTQSSLGGGISVYANTTLTIADCGGSGKITGLSNQVINGYTGSTVHVTGGTIDASESSKSGAAAVFMSDGTTFTMTSGTLVGDVGLKTGGSATISGGSIDATTYGVQSNANSAQVSISGSAAITSGSSGVFVNNGSLSISGGSVSGTEKGVYLYSTSPSVSLEISGGTVSAGGSGYAVYHQAGSPLYLSGNASVPSLYIKDSTENVVYASKAGTAYTGISIAVTLGSTPTAGTAVIQGISGNADYFTFAGDGYSFEADDDGNLVLTEGEPEPDGHTHSDAPDIEWEAWDGKTALNRNGYYYLNSDATITSKVTVSADVTLCLYGNTLTSSIAPMLEVTGSLTICDCGTMGSMETSKDSSSSYIIKVTNGNLTLESGTIKAENCRGISLSGGSVSIEGGELIAGDYAGIYITNGEVTMSGGTITYNSLYGINCSGASSTVQITGGSIIAGSENASLNKTGVYMNKGALTVSGDPIITGVKYGIQTNTGSAQITGGTITATAADGYGLFVGGSGKVAFGGSPTFVGGGADLRISSSLTAPSATVGDTPYSGEEISIYFAGTSGGTVITDVDETSASSFKLIYPTNKYLAVDQSGNLNLSDEEPESPEPGHSHEDDDPDVTWTVWDGNSSLDTEGYYYLESNQTMTEGVEVSADVTLCLYGNTLSGSAASLLTVKDGCTLTICDCQDEAGSIVNNQSSGTNLCVINVQSHAKLILENGSVSLPNGKSSTTNAVNVSGSFEMRGGSVSGGYAGVYLNSSADDAVITGGSISGSSYGIRVSNQLAELSISGGEISTTGVAAVYMEKGSLTLSGGTITGGTDGVRLSSTLSSGKFVISGGTITNTGSNGYSIRHSSASPLYLTGEPLISSLNINKAGTTYAAYDTAKYDGDTINIHLGNNIDAEDVVLYEAETLQDKFNLASPAGKYLIPDGNGNLKLSDTPAPVEPSHPNHGADGTGELPADEEWVAWDGSAFTEAGYYYLEDNINLDSSITISKNINLCLNGHTISRTSGSEVFKVTSGTFTICDCATEPGSISYSGSSNGAAVNITRGTLNLYHVTLSGGNGTGVNASGIYTKVNVYSGTISGSGSKGALNISGSKAYLVGGSISGNIQLQNRAELNLGDTSITGTVNLKSSGTAAGYLSTINASANDVPYSGGKITITTNDANVPADTVIVHKVTDKNAASFELRDYQLTRSDDTLVVGDNSMDFGINVEIPDGGITYGAIDPDGYPVSVTFTGGKPEDVELRYQVEGTSKLYQATIEENQADQTKATLYPTTAGDFTITVTATAQGYNETIKTVTVEVIKPKLTITAKDQVLIAGGTIVESLEQIIVEGNTVNGDVLTGIGLLLIKNDQNEPKFIEPHTAVITNENNPVPEANVSFCYDITYINGNVVDQLPDQEMPRLSVTVTPSSLTYGQTAWARVSGAPSDVDVTYTYSIVGSDGIATINEQTGEITATGIGRFQVTVIASADGYTNGEAISEVITVNRATPTPEEDPSDLTATYGDTLADIDLPDGWTWKNPSTSVGDVGIHKFEAVYQETPEEYYIPVTVELSVEVTPKSISGASIELGASLTYTGEELTQTVAGVSVDGVNLDPQDYAVTYNKATDAGTYTLTITGTGNYTGTATKQWSIAKAASEVTTAPNGKTGLVYTGTAQALVTDGTATGGIMVYRLDGQDYDDVVPTGINAGTYTVWYKVEGDENHSDTDPVKINVSIDKANLTVTAENKRIFEGSPAPTYTASYSGFVNNETKYVLSGELKFTCSYTTGSKPGTYEITLSGLTSTNYDIEFVTGTLTVVAVGEILPPAAKKLTYTGKLQELIVPAVAADDVDLFYRLDGSSFSETIPAAKDAGTYTVDWKAEKNGTTVESGSLKVTIEKAQLTVKANDIWVYAGDAPKFTVTIKGYVNGEDGRVLEGDLTFTCDYSQKYSKPGSSYTITPQGLKADNYAITFNPGILTVKDPLSPRFNVYVLESKHGTVEADCRYARKGDVVTLTIKPDWGYELKSLTVTDSHGDELKLTYHSNGTYTFTMPRDNVTVEAIFTVRDMPFVDVPGNAWYADGVRYVYAYGLMNGTGNWYFSPNRTTTRAMIATILYRIEGSPRVYGTSQFGDVEANSWYEDAVIWATQNDIVEGYNSKTFGPNDPITREQMAAMLYRYADYCGCDMSAGRYIDLSQYVDMDEISTYAIPALRWAVGEEIIEGRTGKRLAPTDTASRAEVAVMLMRFCEDVIW